MQSYNNLVAKCKVLGMQVPYIATYNEEYDAICIEELNYDTVVINIGNNVNVLIDYNLLKDLRYTCINKKIIFTKNINLICDDNFLILLLEKNNIKFEDAVAFKKYLMQSLGYIYTTISHSSSRTNTHSLSTLHRVCKIIRNNFNVDNIDELIEDISLLKMSFMGMSLYDDNEIISLTARLSKIIENL